MRVEIVLLPRELRADELSGRTAVVFDVLRATTTMSAALAAGAKEIRCFGDLELATSAARSAPEKPLLCGERNAVKPAGFDLGNSPGEFCSDLVSGRILYMTTTNGTRAILAARTAQTLFTGALVNARAVADAVLEAGRDVTLLCSGTQGEISAEDLLGAGAVIDSMKERESSVAVELATDITWVGWQLFLARRGDLVAALSATRGGHNVTRAGLTPDIAFAARLNAVPVVGIVAGDPPIVRCWK